MQTFTPDPTKLFHSRLWCWGALVGSVIAFLICNVVALDPEIGFMWYLTAFLVANMVLVVYLAEHDYKQHEFSLSQDSVRHSHDVITLSQLDDFVWQIAPFPQTDNGGCRFVSGNSTIEFRFKYLSDDDAMACLKWLRKSIPLELQRNWPQYCHTTALRLHNEMHHPERELPPPEEDEQQPLKQSNNRRGWLLLAFIVGGFVISFAVGAILERLGFPNAMAWSVGVFFIAQMIARASMVTNRPIVERKYLAAQQIWQTEVMKGSTVNVNSPVA